MIKIISADINAGKTTWLRENFARENKGDGFLSIKTFVEDVHSGYDLLHLRTGNRQPFIRKVTHLEKNWQEAFCLASFFSFHKKGFPFAEEIAREALRERVAPFYFDEVGPLELKGKGFAPLFKQLIDAKVDLIVAIRFFLVDEVKKTFEINDAEIVKL